MKIYTEVNYEWRDDQLVQTSSESFDYEGEVEQCWGFKPPKISNPFTQINDAIVNTAENIDINPATSDINVPTIKPPDISNTTDAISDLMSNFQVDTSGANSMITGALDKIGEGGAYFGHHAQRLKRRLEQGVTEAFTGQGDYADDINVDFTLINKLIFLN